MADEGSAGDFGADSGSEDSEAQGLLADALGDQDSSQEDDSGDQQLPEWAQKKLAKVSSEAKNLRSRVKELQPLADEAQQLRDSQKSELEKLTEKASGFEERATAAEIASMRLEVALDKAPEGMPVSKIRTLAKRLSGSTQEELEQDATELFAEFAPVNGDEDKPSGQRPKESLGKVPLPNSDRIQLDDETDPRKLASKIRRV
jgi:hypothetical protein